MTRTTPRTSDTNGRDSGVFSGTRSGEAARHVGDVMGASPARLAAPEKGPVTPSPRLHADIARRAYEIYVGKGSRPGQCTPNWLQAERELRGPAAKQPAASGAAGLNGEADRYSELLNGKRPAADARLIRDVMSASPASTPTGPSEPHQGPEAIGETRAIHHQRDDRTSGKEAS